MFRAERAFLFVRRRFLQAYARSRASGDRRFVAFVGTLGFSYEGYSIMSCQDDGEPECIDCARNAARIFCGGEHTLVRDPDTLEVYQLGACGLGFNHDDEKLASQASAYCTKLPLNGPALSVFPGYYHNLVKLAGGRCFSYGCGRQDPNDGQLMNGDIKEETYPTESKQKFFEASLGGHHSIARTLAGKVFACGAGWQGQMGNGSLEYKNPAFVQIVGLPKISRVASGYYHNAARSIDGEWYIWGCNESGQLGPSPDPQILVPQPVSDLVPELKGKNVVDFEAGYVHTVLRLDDGSVWTLGGHTEGQRAVDPDMDEPVPLNRVQGLPGPAEAIAAGNHHSLAIVRGNIYAWGSDEFGQVHGKGCPDEDADHRAPSPVLVKGLPSGDPVIRVSAGICHSAAQTKSGRMFLWGCGSNGQTGDGTLPASSLVREVKLDDIIDRCKR